MTTNKGFAPIIAIIIAVIIIVGGIGGYLYIKNKNTLPIVTPSNTLTTTVVTTTSTVVTINSNNQVPQISSATVGGGESGFLYTLDGSGFTNDSVVYVDGSIEAKDPNIALAASAGRLIFGTSTLAAGNHTIYVQNSFGKSNSVTLTISGSVN